MSEQRIELGDNLAFLATLPDASVSAIVTDPPYGLGKPPPIRDLLRAWLADEDHDHLAGSGGFMGRKWDAIVPHPRLWAECIRVLKPGGHLITFAGQRTAHLMGTALEIGGAQIRDSGAWACWSGFPKSLDVSKAIDRVAGAQREVVGVSSMTGRRKSPSSAIKRDTGFGREEAQVNYVTAPATPDAHRWNGWGTALKPCLEPWILARKPFHGTVAANVLEHGTGALNIDACRYPYGDPAWPGPSVKHATLSGRGWNGATVYGRDGEGPTDYGMNDGGRWPANVYYCPKASTAEREAGLDDFEPRQRDDTRAPEAPGANNPRNRGGAERKCSHPTVKPVRLMRWLLRLVSPPGGLVIDPFVGSGTTCIAAALEGIDCIGIEQSAEYAAIARARLAHWQAAGGYDRAIGSTAEEVRRQPSLF